MNLNNLIKKGIIYSVGLAIFFTATQSASQYIIISQGIKESRKHPEIHLNLEDYEHRMREWPSERNAVSELERKIFPYIRPPLKLIEISSRPGRNLAYWVYDK